MNAIKRRVGVIGFDNVNAVDLVGPLEVFAEARGHQQPCSTVQRYYDVQVIGLTDAPFTAESGVRFVPHCSLLDAPVLDTLIVPGGTGIRDPATNATVANWLHQHAPRIRRVATVCTGIYALAATGLLDGHRVTTHWRHAEKVARKFPRLTVDGNALFIKDGSYYTSGGITAGIDLALALIEEDCGSRVALQVARNMVVYLKRPGGQEQYSQPLRNQMRASDGFADIIAWIAGHLHEDLSVQALAARAHLSPRHFSRRFAAAFGCSPAQHVESIRLNEAREQLTNCAATIESIAASVGFASADVFRRSFERRFGITPRLYRERFQSAQPSPHPFAEIQEFVS